ncbi:hypothetical protein [Actinophytocola sp.]|jgi:hypothetical protein|uniref:hypothetical protein n=1 Tax=Actinophytocola sp. TaxID=1872138 RepID=UPI002D27545B|nr:hypothetical protein [Actinophytocola sp.]HYQ66899.1 hypothetical protein [Actinophytocola sp.]
MSVALQEIMPVNMPPATDELTDLLAVLGFDADVRDVELELAIDQFDQWTNPRDAVLVNSSGIWPGTDVELERRAA